VFKFLSKRSKRIKLFYVAAVVLVSRHAKKRVAAAADGSTNETTKKGRPKKLK
jgi:hypothetical protein